jgi:phospholipase C
MKRIMRVVAATSCMLLAGILYGCGGGGSSSAPPNSQPNSFPSIDFTAQSTAIVAGASTVLNWSTTNATSVSISGIGPVAVNGSITVSPSAPTNYTATASGPGGKTTATVSVAVTSVTISASPSDIVTGQSATLTWNSTDATTVSINPGVGAVAASGSTTVSPSSTTTYTITGTSPQGQSVTATARITVGSVAISASPAAIVAGQSTTLTWSSLNAVSASINPGIGNVAPSGSLAVSPAATTTYTIVATRSNGSMVSASTTVDVTSVTISASPASIATGQSSTLTWSSSDAASVSISPGIGSVSGSGSVNVSPTSTTTYTATATNSLGATITASTTVTVNTAIGLSAIRHIIFFLQENRSFDTYFGRLGAYRAARGYTDSFNGVPLTVKLNDKAGEPISPFHVKTTCQESPSASWNSSHIDYNGGRMNAFMDTAPASTIDPNGTWVMGYYDWNQLPYYYELAFQFATSDSWFSPVMAATVINRMYLFSGTSAGNIDSNTIPPPGGWTMPTIFTRLDSKGVSWRYYYTDPALIRLKSWASYNPNNVFPISQYYLDVQNDHSLPSVIFIDSSTTDDEHPGRDMAPGAQLGAQIINGLLNSSSWNDSVFILSYDEGGGMYDHVPPVSLPPPDNIPPMLTPTSQPGTFGQSGFRVPLIVISPYVKPHFVSHVARDYTSILRLIEVRFGLNPLTARDAAADDMTEFFDLTSPPALLTPPSLPAPANSWCNFTAEKAPGQ